MATAIKRTRSPRVRPPGAETKKTPDPSTLTDADIARRAFELYCARGGKDGHDLEDWLQAERELRGFPPMMTVDDALPSTSVRKRTVRTPNA